MAIGDDNVARWIGTRASEGLMLTFLFWNMGGRTEEPDLPRRARCREGRLASILANFTRQFVVDLLILAECPMETLDVLDSINAGSGEPFWEPDPKSLCKRIRIFPR